VGHVRIKLRILIALLEARMAGGRTGADQTLQLGRHYRMVADVKRVEPQGLAFPPDGRGVGRVLGEESQNTNFDIFHGIQPKAIIRDLPSPSPSCAAGSPDDSYPVR